MKKVSCKKNCPLPDATCLSYFYKSLPRDNLPSSNTFFYPSYGLSFLFFSDAVTTVMIIKVVIYCYLWEFIQLIRCSVTCILKSVSKREKKIIDFFFKILACPDIKPESDPDFILSSYNASAGTQVLIGCKKFGYRLEGPHNVTCYSNRTWSDNLSELECKCMSLSWFIVNINSSINER